MSEIEQWSRYYKIEDNEFVGFFLEKEGTEEEQEQFYEITKEEHEALMKGQAEGKTIVYKDGKLVLVEQEETLTKDQLLEQKINCILEYSKLEENKKIIEASKFSTEHEIKAITEKMSILEENINTITEKLKAS